MWLCDWTICRDDHGLNWAGSVYRRFGSVRFTSELGEPSTQLIFYSTFRVSRISWCDTQKVWCDLDKKCDLARFLILARFNIISAGIKIIILLQIHRTKIKVIINFTLKLSWWIWSIITQLTTTQNQLTTTCNDLVAKRNQV